MAVQLPSRRLHHKRLFHPLNGTEHGSPPSLTTRDRELVSVLEVIIEPGDLNLKPLTPQSVTLPTLPRAGHLIIFLTPGHKMRQQTLVCEITQAKFFCHINKQIIYWCGVNISQ